MTTTRSPEFTGRHMWIVVCIFFGVIITVNIGMAIVASTSWTGLVVTNSYVASQEFEEKRIAHDRQVAAGWEATFSHTGGVTTLSIVDADGAAVELTEPALKVNRPVGGHDDQTVLLERQADGSYAGPLTLDAGIWDARIQAGTALGPYELHQRFTVGKE